MILTGTADGLYAISLDGDIVRHSLESTEIVAVSGDWAIVDGVVRSLVDHEVLALPEGLVPRCLLSDDKGCVIGTSEARLFAVDKQGAKPFTSFDYIPTRPEWSTPWGGPPDTRSVTRAESGLLVNVHVGGVWRAEGEVWVEAVEAAADAHQVIAVGSSVAVAAAVGVGQSDDTGATWHWSDEGLHASYCRAATIAEGWLLVSASDGPGSKRGSVYRRPLVDPEKPFEPCGPGGGLPESFPYNIDTFELTASGALVVLGTASGELYASDDSGENWRLLVDALPGVRCVDLRLPE